MLVRFVLKTQWLLCHAQASSQNWQQAILVAVFSLSTVFSDAHGENSPYNAEALSVTLENTPELLPPFGKMQTRPWHIHKDTITTGEAVPFDTNAFDFLAFPQNPQLLAEAPPAFLQQWVDNIQILVFGKTGVVRFGLTKDSTAAYLKEKTVTLGKDILDLERGNKDEKINLAFIVAHEISHLIIFNEEIRTGFTPSGFVTAAREFIDYSFTPNEFEKFIETVVFPKESLQAHAEVDFLACLILKKLNMDVPSRPLDRLMKKARDNKETSASIEAEYTERMSALKTCRALRK